MTTAGILHPQTSGQQLPPGSWQPLLDVAEMYRLISVESRGVSRLAAAGVAAVYRILEYQGGTAEFNWLAAPEPLTQAPVQAASRNDPAAQRARNAAAIRLLDAWREGDAEEQRETWEYLKRALDEDRPSGRELFPAT